MDLIKWVGIIVLSLVMATVATALAKVAVPSMPVSVGLVLDIVVAALVLRPMISAVRIASTMETYHGKQFD